ncbi:MAG: HPr family phosphocarrier protein [Bacillota bacterium]
MITLSLQVNNKSGLHARPAALFVQTAKTFQSSVKVKKDAKQVDGKSLLSLMTLGAGPGSQVEVTVDGPDEADAAKAIQDLANDNFGEH